MSIAAPHQSFHFRNSLPLQGACIVCLLVCWMAGKRPGLKRFFVRVASIEIVYVDARRGSDANSGISDRPFKTISRGVQLALQNFAKNQSTRIMIAPGTYREAIVLTAKSPSPGAQIEFQGASSDSVTVSGADVWTDWRKSDDLPGTYTHEWGSQEETCRIPEHWGDMQQIVLRREMIFVGGEPLTQVLSQSQLNEGTFYADGTEGRILIHPRSGTDLANTIVEVAVRSKLLNDQGVSGISIRRMTFEKANTCLPGGAVQFFNSSNNLIEDAQIRWNNFHGLELHAVSDTVVSHTTATHNGGAGLHGYQLKNVRYEDVESSFNNWRGASGQFYFVDVAGVKLMRAHKVTLTGLHVLSNQSSGLWFDTDDRDVTIANANLSRNMYSGLFLEASQGPIRVQGARVCYNGAEGVRILNAEGITIEQSLLLGNRSAQLFVDSRVKRREGKDWETSQPYSLAAATLTLSGNTFVASDPSQSLITTRHADKESADIFIRSFSSRGNTWYSAESTNVFQQDTDGTGRSPKTDFAHFRAFNRQDSDSVFGPAPGDVTRGCEQP